MSAEQRGPFEILEIPASGAYGAIAVAKYRAEGDRVVAVKAMRSDYMGRPKIMARARDEARILFRVRHPNIVQVEELLEVNGRPVLIMEWVEGSPLSDLINESVAIRNAEALEITRLTALALDAAYNGEFGDDGAPLRIIHRDIKPANVLLSVAGEVKVVDFGVARGDFEDRETSTVTTIMGTQAYMAPEILAGVSNIPAIDVYSLGVTLHQLLTGRMLAPANHPDRHNLDLRRQLEPVRELPEIGPAVADLLERMCTYVHADRPTAAEVAERVREILEGTGRPPDLLGFARQHVAPMYEARPRPSPREHREYPHLAFLERPWGSKANRRRKNGKSVPITVLSETAKADLKLRKFLATPGWAKRVKELTWLLATNSEWTAAPLLEVLARANQPWWRFWAKRPNRRAIAVALQMLRYRRSPTVLEMARRFAGHWHRPIADAAATLLEGADTA